MLALLEMDGHTFEWTVGVCCAYPSQTSWTLKAQDGRDSWKIDWHGKTNDILILLLGRDIECVGYMVKKIRKATGCLWSLTEANKEAITCALVTRRVKVVEKTGHGNKASCL
jgi:hypothetical protein